MHTHCYNDKRKPQRSATYREKGWEGGNCRVRECFLLRYIALHMPKAMPKLLSASNIEEHLISSFDMTRITVIHRLMCDLYLLREASEKDFNDWVLRKKMSSDGCCFFKCTVWNWLHTPSHHKTICVIFKVLIFRIARELCTLGTLAIFESKFDSLNLYKTCSIKQKW